LPSYGTVGGKTHTQRFSPKRWRTPRTLESFRERLAAALSETRVAGPKGAPLGLCILKRDELNQLYVSAEARGAGVAAALLADAESILAARGGANRLVILRDWK
jgi:GNAT superfamily N-acetyltransferase